MKRISKEHAEFFVFLSYVLLLIPTISLTGTFIRGNISVTNGEE